MYSNLDIELIRIFGRKDLTDGCIITGLCWDSYGELKERRLCRKTYAGYYLVASQKGNFHDNCGSVHKPSSIVILGHIPYLEDVFRVAEEMGFGDIYISSYRNDDGGSGYIRKSIQIKDNVFFYNPTLPLLEQSEETKQALITLFEPCK